MPKTIRKCKVCGKDDEYCKTWVSANKFRYQDVACSPECGSKYFAMIEASRSEKKDAEEAEAPKKSPKKMLKKAETQADEPADTQTEDSVINSEDAIQWD